MLWPTLDAEGCTWEIRAIANESGTEADQDILEFRPREPTLPPRRLAVARGVLESMNEAELRSAFQRARPIGGDFYGRPGKRMPDSPGLK